MSIDIPTLGNILWNPIGGSLWFSLIVAVAILGVLVYSSKLRKQPLPRGKFLTLATLRFALIACLIVSLANPTQVIEITKTQQIPERYAVLFDTSGSMRLKNAQGQSRLEDSITFFEKMAEAMPAGSTFDFFSLDTFVSPANDLNTFAQLDETPILSELNKHLLNLDATIETEGYSKIFTFTDAINTGKSWQNTVTRTQPHPMTIFVPDLDLLPSASGRIFQLEHVHTSPVGSVATINFAYEANHLPNTTPLEVTLSDQVGNVLFEKVISQSDSNDRQFGQLEIPIIVQNAGWEPFNVELKSGDTIYDASQIFIGGESSEPARILILQGYVDLNLAPLRQVFSKNDNYEISYRFLNDNWVSYGNESYDYRLRDFYDVVLLLNLPDSDALNTAGERLRSFVSDGGSLVCLVQDRATAAAINESRYKTLFPLLPKKERRPEELGNLIFNPDNGRISMIGTPGPKSRFSHFEKNYKERIRKQSAEGLHAFVLTKEGLLSKIFNDSQGNALNIPYFQNAVTTEKPQRAAQILAKTSTEAPQPLLASQYYGDGQIIQLNSGALWEWNGSLEAKSTAFEQFWRNLLGYATNRQVRQNSWEIVPFEENNRTYLRTTLKLANRKSDADYSFFLDLDGQKSRFVPRRNSKGYFTAELPISNLGTYRVIAETSEDDRVQAYYHHRKSNQSLEYRELDPDYGNAAFIASHIPGAEVVSLSDKPKLDLMTSQLSIPKVETMNVPLWHSPIFIALMLGLFCLEIFLRRIWKTI